jgi:hypothetical protein
MSSAILFVLDVPEFASIVAAGAQQRGCQLSGPVKGYYVLRADMPMQFDRRALGLKPAVWYGIPTGGIVGKITRFDRDTLVIEPATT